jgi:protein-disulfide isomerase
LLLRGKSVAAAGRCHVLRGPKLKLAQALYEAVHPYDCCDETLASCLKQRKVCKLATRLRDEICRRLLGGQNAAQIKSAIERRARSMTPVGKRASIDLTGAPASGSASAPVTVAVYACARCRMCSRTLPMLDAMVTRGALRGRVKIHLKPFPIRGHSGSLEGGLALVAAARLGKLWPYLRLLYRQFDSFSKDKLASWAKGVGMDPSAFTQQMSSSSTRSALIKSKKEGLRNKVNATPTLFINGRRYVGDLDRESLKDVLEEAADRAQGKRY